MRICAAWTLLMSGLLAAQAAARNRSLELVLPLRASSEEKAAASDLARLWLAGRGGQASVAAEPSAPGIAPPSGRILIFLGDTSAGRRLALLSPTLDEDGFRVVVENAGGWKIVLRGRTPHASRFAACWFAQRTWGVRWFAPGPDGEVVPDLSRWKPAPLDQVVQPAFLSRDLDASGPGGPQWIVHNLLRARWPHSHALVNVFTRQLFDAHPDWFPLLEGARYRPQPGGDYNWQPNLALPEVAAHAARYAIGYFKAHPDAEAVSLSMNDSIRFDQSPATLAARGPLRWFRRKPVYSDLIFAFMNRVADQVGREYPDKLLSAYAYYWGEDAPSFRLRPNVLPWLTADRTEWRDPRFRAEDQALIRSWCRSGARYVGSYDYYEGSPFLVPRVATRLLADSIRFQYDAGVRAFYAEGEPNWGFDAPERWVAAQLLWDPRQKPEALLDDFYRGYFAEAADPMRRFYDACEEIWRTQPGPPWWIKFYQDEDQAKLYPPQVRKRLRAFIEEARSAARTDVVRRRVDLVSAAFSVTESFAEFCEARDALSIAARAPLRQDRAPLLRLLDDYELKGSAFGSAYGRAVFLGAIAPTDLSVYVRDDPAPRARLGLSGPASGHWQAAPLADPGWDSLRTPPKLDDTTFAWNGPPDPSAGRPWVCRGEPAEGRQIEVGRDPQGRVSVRYRNAISEYISQWVPAVPNALYRGEVLFHGEIGPGEQAFVIMSWLDRNGQRVGSSVADRVPLGRWDGGFPLMACGRSPPSASLVGIGFYLYHQLPGHYALFSRPGLLSERE